MSTTAVASPEYDVIIGTAPMMSQNNEAASCCEMLATALGVAPIGTLDSVYLPESLWQRIASGAEGAVLSLGVNEGVELRAVEAALASTGLDVEVIYVAEQAAGSHFVFGLRGNSVTRTKVSVHLAAHPGVMLEVLHA
ncbi:MAG: hypothetical protein Q3972_07155 [Corynebacterium sp.]|nr:hypothetical protein [Corynebacterium sp.]